MKISNLSNRINVTLLGLILGIAAVGCKTKSTGVTPLSSSSSTGTAHTPDPGPGKALANDTEKPLGSDIASTGITDPDVRKNWPRDHEIFKSDIVHFDYDSSVIKSEEKPKLAAVADYVKAHPMDALEIEGHCDVRGTEEYNRSLGERRALALREELIRLGIEASRIDTVSYGEDRPADPGHDDAAYKKNRRGEFALEKHQTLAGLSTPPNNDLNK